MTQTRERSQYGTPLPAGRDHGTPQPAAAYGMMLAAFLGLLLAARLVALRYNGTDLFFDEAQYWSWSRELTFGYYSKPPLIAWLIRAFTETCGVSEACVRMPSALLHTATAAVIFLLARRLYDGQVGFWSGLTYATLPGVSLSAGIISTDVPLLFFWAVALLALLRLMDGKAWWPALMLGVAIGLGLNAKYAMALFVLCLGVYLIATPERRWLLSDPRLWAALAIGVALITPNLLWNWLNSFATFSHTADNAKWGGSLLKPLKALEFFGSQFGVFGPILFASLGVVAMRAWRSGAPDADRILLAFALPIIALFTIQAFLSRAHANWGATAYVAGTVVVVATLVRDLSWRWLKASLALHVALALLLAVAVAQAGGFRLPGAGDPFQRTLGWKALAEETRKVVGEARRQKQGYAAVLTDDRSVTAELLYYLRDEAVEILAWRATGRPRDHYELTRPFSARTGSPVLLVTLKPDPGPLLARFETVRLVAERQVPAGLGKPRRVRFYALSGYKPQ
ncbi:MAG: ArnT family glycosyltransferase [Hyphomicrobiaceae bacterium]